MALTATPGIGRAADTDSETATSPNASVSIEDEFSPAYDDLSGSSNTINLRAQIPWGKPLLLFAGTGRRLHVLRIRLPFVTSAPANAITGSGDTTLVGLAIFDSKTSRWVIGPSLRLPTASHGALGSGKWQIGPAAGYTLKLKSTTLGIFTQNFFSFAGDGSRPPVARSQLDPTIVFALPGGWAIGTSQMRFTYDWNTRAWTDVPLGVRIERSGLGVGGRLTAAIEAEKNLADVRGASAWTLRASLLLLAASP